MENTIARNEFGDITTDLSKQVKEEIFGEKVGLMARILGCWHRRMSKPVTTQNITYRFCPTCGIRRRYDLENFKAQGSFYYPAENKDLHHV